MAMTHHAFIQLSIFLSTLSQGYLAQADGVPQIQQRQRVAPHQTQQELWWQRSLATSFSANNGWQVSRVPVRPVQTIKQPAPAIMPSISQPLAKGVNASNARVVAVLDNAVRRYFATPATNYHLKPLQDFEPSSNFPLKGEEIGNVRLASWDQLPTSRCVALPGTSFSCLVSNGKATVIGKWYLNPTPLNNGTFTFRASFTHVRILGDFERDFYAQINEQRRRRRRSSDNLGPGSWGPTEVSFEWNVAKDQDPKRRIDMAGFAGSKLVLTSVTDASRMPSALQQKQIQDDVTMTFVRRPIFQVLEDAGRSPEVEAAVEREGASLEVNEWI